MYAVGPDKVVKLRRVQLGPTEAGVVSVRSGVAAGDTLVVDGAEKVQDGARAEPTVRQPGAPRGGAPGGGPPGGGAPPTGPPAQSPVPRTGS